MNMKNKVVLITIIIILCLSLSYKFLTRKNGKPDDGYYICNFIRTYEVIDVDNELKKISLRNNATNISIENISLEQLNFYDLKPQENVAINFELIPTNNQLDDSNLFENAKILNVEKTNKNMQEPICVGK